nr:AAA family ATPase [Virgibacillus sp. LDC-1]
MIIWLNGTFGVGKTTLAFELKRRLDQAIVYDPEHFGAVFMANIPRVMAEADFQDYSLWREANYKLLHHISETYNGPIIVPMTLTNPSYFNEIIGKLRRDGRNVHHFALMASPQTIAKRLRKRLEGSRSWSYRQMQGRLQSLQDTQFGIHLLTDGKTVDDLVETIASRCELSLLPDKRTIWRKKWDYISIQMKERLVWIK